MSDKKSSIREVLNLWTDAGRSTDTERYLSGDVWTDIQKYGHSKHGGGMVKCHAKALKLCMKLWMYFTEEEKIALRC